LADVLIKSVETGHSFGPYDVTISPERSASYNQAVGGDESPDYGISLAPMMTVAAALTELIEDLGLFSEGLQTVHAGQEASWIRSINAGEQITATGTLASSSMRRGSKFATVKVEYTDADGSKVGDSSTTIIVSGVDP